MLIQLRHQFVMACYQFETIYIGLIFILLGVHLTLQFHIVNVAYQRRVKMCDEVLLSDMMTDGDRNQIVNVTDISECVQNMYFTIALNMPYFIQCVIIFPGKITLEKNVNHPLDYYTSTLGDPADDDCGEFTKPIRIIRDFSKGLRINCKKSEFVFQEVTFALKARVPFSIAEIEVYTFGSSESANASYIHRGCFTEFTFRSEFNFNDILSCRSMCMDNGTSIMAVSQPLGKCRCGFTFDETHEVSMTTCFTTCAGLNKKCGGSNEYSVYILRYQIPYFMGCTSEAAPDSKIETIENITIGKCMKHCHNFSNVWIKGNSCVCFKKYLTKGDVNDCDNKCAGDPENVCGGLNHASIYATCKDRYNIYFSCKKLLHCIDDDYDEFGVCSRGCTEGFSGTYCIERVSYAVYTTSSQDDETTIKESKGGQPARLDSNFVMRLAAILLLLSFI